MRTTNTQKLEFGNSAMRVRTFTLLLIIFLLSCGASFATLDQPDYIAPKSKVDFDFNLQASFQVQGLFEVADDIDVYRVVVSGNSYLDIETSGDVDPYLRLYTQKDSFIIAFCLPVCQHLAQHAPKPVLLGIAPLLALHKA